MSGYVKILYYEERKLETKNSNRDDCQEPALASSIR